MRSGALLGLALLLPLAACETTEKHLKEVSWGDSFSGDFDRVVDRARMITLQEFPRGLDPDKDDSKGEFWTVFHYSPDPFYRNTRRTRARVVVEKQAGDRVRVGVAITYEINDNIDNPSNIDEARWVKPTRDGEREARMEARIAQRYKEFQPSEAYREKQKPPEERGKAMRDDIVDRNKDVNLEDANPDPNRKTPGVTGENKDPSPK